MDAAPWLSYEKWRVSRPAGVRVRMPWLDRDSIKRSEHCVLADANGCVLVCSNGDLVDGYWYTREVDLSLQESSLPPSLRSKRSQKAKRAPKRRDASGDADRLARAWTSQRVIASISPTCAPRHPERKSKGRKQQPREKQETKKTGKRGADRQAGRIGADRVEAPERKGKPVPAAEATHPRHFYIWVRRNHLRPGRPAFSRALLAFSVALDVPPGELARLYFEMLKRDHTDVPRAKYIGPPRASHPAQRGLSGFVHIGQGQTKTPGSWASGKHKKY